MPKKLKRIEIEQLGNLQQALSLAADSVEAARNFARAVDEQANGAVEKMRETLQKHMDRKDLRPHALFRPHGKGVWTISFNSETYSLGPNEELSFDDEDMNFWWQAPDSDKKPCKTLFMGLIAIVQHYCNQEDIDDLGASSGPNQASPDNQSPEPSLSQEAG